MHTLDFIVQPRIAPNLSLAEDLHFLHAVGRRSRTRLGVLRVYDFAGDVLSIGRYHLAPPRSDAHPNVQPYRRQSGGKAIPFGDGFVAVTLVLPHRSALVSNDFGALAPYQVLNRYVRGILEACKLVHVPAFYPGRDLITVDHRALALVSFEVDPTGTLLFEAVIANQRDFSLLPHFLDAVDSTGVIKAEMLTGEDTTCLAREVGTTLAAEDVAELLRRGYAKTFDLVLEDHALTPLEEQAIAATAAHEFDDDRWLQQRHLRLDLDHHTAEQVQLGVLEAHFSLEQDRFIKDIIFAGDFIANSAAIDRLERKLRLCPAERQAIDAVTSRVFADPQSYILGVGPTRVLADVVCKGLTS